MDYETDQRQYEGNFSMYPYKYSLPYWMLDAPRGYDGRDRSRSPHVGNGDGYRQRSASPRDRDRMDTRYLTLSRFRLQK